MALNSKFIQFCCSFIKFQKKLWFLNVLDVSRFIFLWLLVSGIHEVELNWNNIQGCGCSNSRSIQVWLLHKFRLIRITYVIRARWRTGKKTAEAHKTEMRNGVRTQEKTIESKPLKDRWGRENRKAKQKELPYLM